jgi:hypothetical protein
MTEITQLNFGSASQTIPALSRASIYSSMATEVKFDHWKARRGAAGKPFRAWPSSMLWLD